MTWAFIIVLAIALNVALIAGWGGSTEPKLTYPMQPQGEGYCQDGDVLLRSDRLGTGFCTPRLCQEDEILDWVANDVRGCVQWDEAS